MFPRVLLLFGFACVLLTTTSLLSAQSAPDLLLPPSPETECDDAASAGGTGCQEESVADSSATGSDEARDPRLASYNFWIILSLALVVVGLVSLFREGGSNRP